MEGTGLSIGNKCVRTVPVSAPFILKYLLPLTSRSYEASPIVDRWSNSGEPTNTSNAQERENSKYFLVCVPPPCPNISSSWFQCGIIAI